MVIDEEAEMGRIFGNVTKVVMPRRAAPPLPAGGNRPTGSDFQNVHNLIRHQHREMAIPTKQPVSVRYFWDDSTLEVKGKMKERGEQ